MDINLPGISGITALRILAQDPATAHIPVIALSANAMPRDIEKGLEAGFFRYLTKPIKVNEFMDTLDRGARICGNAMPAAAISRRKSMMVSAADILNASILIVDDQEANVSLLEQLLSEAGYTRVASTMNPQEVCALHRKNAYDLILLDLQMPGMDGFQVMAGLKTNNADSYLPVIVLTAQPGTSCARCRPAQRISSASRSIWSKSRRASTTCWKCGCCTSSSRTTTSSWNRRSRNGPPSCAKAKRAIAA